MKIGKIELTREKLIIIAAVAVITIALAVYFIFYAPLVKNLMTARLECLSEESELLECRNIVESAGKTTGKRVLISEEDASLAIRALTEHGELSDSISLPSTGSGSLEESRATSRGRGKHDKLKGVDFISINPKEIKDENSARYKILPLEMEIESTYGELGMFIGSLDELERALVKVKSFDIVPDKEDAYKLTTDLVVEIYLSGGKNE